MTTAAADTPTSPDSDFKPIDQVIADRAKNRPKLEKPDLKSFSDMPESQEVSDIPAQETAADFLARLEGQEPPVNEDEVKPYGKKKPSVETVDLGIEGLEIGDEVKPDAKDGKPLTDKEKNFAALRAKEKAAEDAAKQKEQEVETYRKRAEELEETIKRIAFEKSDEFKKDYQSPLDNAKAAATTFAKEYGDEGTAAKALSLKGRERLDFIDDTFGSGAAAGRFLSLIEAVESKQASLEEAIANRPQTEESWAKRGSEERQKHLDRINANFDKVKDHLSSRSTFFKKTGDAEQDKVIDGRIERAKSRYLGTASEKDLALTPWLAEIGAEAVSELARVNAELDKYKARERENSSSSPRIHRGANDDGSNGNGKPVGGIAGIRSALSSGNY